MEYSDRQTVAFILIIAILVRFPRVNQWRQTSAGEMSHEIINILRFSPSQTGFISTLSSQTAK